MRCWVRDVIPCVSMPLLACPWEGCTGAPHPSSRTVRPWGAPLPASALSISEVFTPEVLYPFYVCVLSELGIFSCLLTFSSLETDLCVDAGRPQRNWSWFHTREASVAQQQVLPLAGGRACLPAARKCGRGPCPCGVAREVPAGAEGGASAETRSPDRAPPVP